MDGIRWYLRGLLNQAPPAPFVPFTLPAPTDDGLLGRVQGAAQRYYNTVNVVLSDDQAAAVRAWGQRRQRILAWLEVLDAGDDLDRAAAALASVAATGDGSQKDSTTTVFDEIQSLAASEARVNVDRASLQQAVAFYLSVVDHAVDRFGEVLRSCDDAEEQDRCAEKIIEFIDRFTMRICHIQRLYGTPAGSRPTL